MHGQTRTGLVGGLIVDDEGLELVWQLNDSVGAVVDIWLLELGGQNPWGGAGAEWKFILDICHFVDHGRG